jgi:hypothetical protein
MSNERCACIVLKEPIVGNTVKVNKMKFQEKDKGNRNGLLTVIK